MKVETEKKVSPPLLKPFQSSLLSDGSYFTGHTCVCTLKLDMATNSAAAVRLSGVTAICNANAIAKFALQAILRTHSDTNFPSDSESELRVPTHGSRQLMNWESRISPTESVKRARQAGLDRTARERKSIEPPH